MVIFNSYVKLPEGNLRPQLMLLTILATSSGSSRPSTFSGGKRAKLAKISKMAWQNHDARLVLQMAAYTLVCVYIYIYACVCAYVGYNVIHIHNIYIYIHIILGDIRGMGVFYPSHQWVSLGFHKKKTATGALWNQRCLWPLGCFLGSPF